MLLQKTLHMSHPVAECKARLASIQSYRRQFLMVTRATVTSSKTVDFSFRGPFGFEAHTVLLSVDSNSSNQYAFESVGGNISVMGIVDFAEIRPHCTEVTVAIHYEIKNKFFAWLDRRLQFVDGFVTDELRSIRAHFEGIRSSYLERARVMPVLQAAHACSGVASSRSSDRSGYSIRTACFRSSRRICRWQRVIFTLGSRIFVPSISTLPCLISREISLCDFLRANTSR